jgi:hypothetical protein
MARLLGTKQLSEAIEQAKDAFQEQGNQYFQLASNYQQLCKPLLQEGGTLDKFAKAAQVISAGYTFSQWCTGIATITATFSGSSAEQHLEKFYKQLGKTASDISKDLHLLANNTIQQHFGQHVFRYVNMRARQLQFEEQVDRYKHYLFVYHHGTDWHPLFYELCEENGNKFSITSGTDDTSDASPSPRFLGVFDNFDTLTTAMQVARGIVGPEPRFHVLMPAAELTVLPEPLVFPSELYPLYLEGQKHSGTGQPYCYVNLPKMPATIFHHVYNLDELKLAEPVRSEMHKFKKGAASAAGGFAGATIGGIVSAGTLGALVAPAAPLALVGGAVMGGIKGGKAAGKAVDGQPSGGQSKQGNEEEECKKDE